MPGRLAIDFGTSNTVVAIWDEAREEGMPLHIPDLSRPMQYGTQEIIWVIPSLIHYLPTGERWLGQQVIERNLYDSNRTFRWMKRYITTRNPARLQVGGKSISYFEAGQAFLSSILLFATGEIGSEDEEVAFTVPVEAFEHYENWLAEVAEDAGMPRFRLIDEPSAAALGYGAHIQPNDVYLVFDFGGGTLDVSVVLIEENETTASGRRCRVLGKTGEDLGGIVIDKWLFQEVLKRNGLSDSDERQRQLGIVIFEVGERGRQRGGETVELVFDPSGAARIREYQKALNEHLKAIARKRLNLDEGAKVTSSQILSVIKQIESEYVQMNTQVADMKTGKIQT